MIPYRHIQSLHIEASSHCNAACPSCPRNYHGGQAFPFFEKKFLSLADHQKFFPLDFAARQKLVIYCGNYGDPTLAPELVEICRWWLTVNPNIVLQINTNAGTRDRGFWEELGKVFKGTNGNVTFSVDGLEDTNHVYRRNVDWQKVRVAMDAFIGAGGPAVWEFLVFEHNQHQVDEARALAQQWGFKEFHAKKAMGFWSQGAMPVVKRDGELDYYIYPPSEESFRNAAAKEKDATIDNAPNPDMMTGFNFEETDLDKFWLDPQQEEKFNGNRISCQTVKDRQIFISADGLVYPCCFIGSRQYAPNSYSFINKQIQQFLASEKKENFSLHHRPLKEVIEDQFFSKGYSDTWDKETVRHGKLAICAEFCGAGVTEFKEATSHRPKLEDEDKVEYTGPTFPVRPRENKNFCLAPWTHTFVSPQSERRLCCASREMPSYTQQYIDQDGGDMTKNQYAPPSLDEHWNSDYMKGIRRKMMNGESVPECEICESQRLHVNTYRDYFTQSLFEPLLDTVEANTTEDGATSWRPRSFDYRFSNLCSFKCRMCGEQLSSAWEQEKRQNGMWDSKTQPWMIPEMRERIDDFTTDVVELEFDRAVDRGDIEEIYWVGGEPTIWPKHWETMAKLIAKGDANKVHVRYNSNLAIVNWKGKHLYHDILTHFKSYQMCASIDATGKIGEWIRTGLDWEKWKENFASGVPYIQDRGIHSHTMDLTLTLPGLFDLKNLLQVARDFDVAMYVKLVYAFDPKVVLSPLALPKEILHPFLDDIIRDIAPLVDDKTRVLLDTLEDLKRRPTFREEYADWRDGFRTGKGHMQEIARIRGDGTRGRLRIEDILSARPDVLRWWENP